MLRDREGVLESVASSRCAGVPMSAAQDLDCDVLVTRVFDAPRSLVFKTWTDPEHLPRWWCPPGFTNTACQIDLRVGGRFCLDFTAPDGERYASEGIYEEIVAPERIVYRGVGDPANPCGCGLPPEGLVTIRFAEEGARQTRLSLHARFVSAAMREAAMGFGFDTIWAQVFEGLAVYIEGIES